MMAGLYSNYASASPADIQRKREIAQRLLMNAQQTQPQTIGEGLGAVGDYIYAGRVGRAADAGDKELRQQAAGLFSGGQPAMPATPVMPSASVEPVQITNLPPPGYGDNVTVGGDGMGDIAPPAQMPEQQTANTEGRFYMTDVGDDELFETLQDPVAVRALEYAAPGKLAMAREEAKLRMEWRQNAPDREYKRLQTDKLRRELEAPQIPDAPTVQKMTMPDGSEQAVQWNGREWVPLNAPFGGKGFGPKLTEGQSKDLGFWYRGQAANESLQKTEGELTSMWSDMKGRLPVIGNWWSSPEYRQAKRDASELLAVILRKDTGAAVTEQEFDLYGPIYLPQPADDPTTLANKRDARARALEAIKRGMGPAQIIAEEMQNLRQPDQGAQQGQPAPQQGGNRIKYDANGNRVQ